MGRDIRFDLGRIDGYKNFCNKLWNAARYVLMNVEKSRRRSLRRVRWSIRVADRWIRSRLGATIEEVRKHLDDYRFDLAAQAPTNSRGTNTATGTWSSRSRHCSPTAPRRRRSAARVRRCSQCSKPICACCIRSCPSSPKRSGRAVAPLAGRTGPTIMLQPYPRAEEFPSDAAAERAIAPVKAVDARGAPDSRPARCSALTANAAIRPAARASRLVDHRGECAADQVSGERNSDRPRRRKVQACRRPRCS